MSLESLQAFFSEDNSQPIGNIDKQVKKPSKAVLTGSIERQRKERELYYKLADNIKKSERLRAELTKGIKNNKPIDQLLLISLECIYLMTGDIAAYKQNIENLEDRA